MSKVAEMKKQIQECQTLLLAHIGMSEEEYTDMYFETAMAFAEKHCLDDRAVTWLTSDPVFWGWWAMEMTTINENFLNRIEYHQESKGFVMVFGTGWITQEAFLEYYKHGVEFNMLTSTRNTQVLQLSFHNMLKRPASFV